MNPSFTFLGSTPSVLEIKWTRDNRRKRAVSYAYERASRDKRKNPKKQLDPGPYIPF